jgi:hypothetical protein
LGAGQGARDLSHRLFRGDDDRQRALGRSGEPKQRAVCARHRDDQGPILSIVEYGIDPTNAAEFLTLIQQVGHERMRDGAYAWNVFHDPDDPGRFVETSLVHSLLELKYRRARETKADELIEAHMHKFLKEPQKPSYFVAPQRQHHKWRGVRRETGR